MESDGWPRVVPERFEGEDTRSYRTRAARIEELITGFRMGRFGRDVAEQRERELVLLQEYSPSTPIPMAPRGLAAGRRFRLHAEAAQA
jgi:hypothetical protein